MEFPLISQHLCLESNPMASPLKSSAAFSAPLPMESGVSPLPWEELTGNPWWSWSANLMVICAFEMFQNQVHPFSTPYHPVPSGYDCCFLLIVLHL